MNRRIVLLGATGYTGRLIARALAAIHAPNPILVGRNAVELAAVAAEVGGMDTAIADATETDAVRRLLQPGDVLISTIGPFNTLGHAALRAAIESRAHYIDSSGGGQWITTVFHRHGLAAVRAGSALLPCFGFEFVPGNLAAELALQGLEHEATAVELVYLPPDVIASSRGTRKAIAQDLLEPGFGYRDGRLVAERLCRQMMRGKDNGGHGPAVSIPGSELLVLPQAHPGLDNVTVFIGGLGRWTRLVQAGAMVSDVLRRSAFTRRMLTAIADSFVNAGDDGPSEAQRDAAVSAVVARAYGSERRLLSEVVLTGPDPYDLTAGMIAWAAVETVTAGLDGVGALGPVEAFGLDRLRAGAASVGLVPTADSHTVEPV